MSRKAEVRELAEDDLPALADYLRARSQEESPDPGGVPAVTPRPSIEKLRWFLFRNPARHPDLPVGWTLRDAEGRVVGAMFCAPQRFRSGDREFLLLMSGSYFVDAPFRGLGMAIFQRYRKLANRHALYCTTANDQSGAFWRRFGGYPIADTDHESIGILRIGPIAEEWLQRRWGRSSLSRLVGWTGGQVPTLFSLQSGRRTSGGELLQIGVRDELPNLDDAAREDVGNRLTAVRDDAFLRWRYLEGPDPTAVLYRFRSGSGADAVVGVNLRNRGHRGQIRALMVLDAWGALPGRSIADLASILAREFSGRADMIVFRGGDSAQHHALRSEGFLRRDFSYPTGWCIDPNELLPTRDWYLMPGDGDTAL